MGSDPDDEVDDAVYRCGHCGDEHDSWGDLSDHDCTPECVYCGKTAADLPDDDVKTDKLLVSAHQRECDEKPEREYEPDPEAIWRRKRRKREKRMEREAKRARERRLGFR